MYQILSQSVRFCGLYIKKHFGVFFSVHSVVICVKNARVPELTLIGTA